MASKNKLIKRPKRKIVNWAGRAEKIRKFRALPFSNSVNFTPAHKATIRRLWEEKAYRYKSAKNLRHVAPATIKKLRESGYAAEDRGVILEPPRDAEGNKIKGVRLTVRKSGVVRQTVGRRTDLTVPLSKKERAEILRRKNPENYIRKILAREKIAGPGKTETKTYKRLKTRIRMTLNVNGKRTGIMSFKDISRYMQFLKKRDGEQFADNFFAVEITEYKTGDVDGKAKRKKKRRK